MDIYCPTCGEPWEMDSLHEEAQDRYGIEYHLYEPFDSSYQSKKMNPEWNADDYHKVYEQVRSEFQSQGCKALKSFGEMDYCKPPESESAKDRAMFAAAAYDILGDDLDGAAAMLDDWC